jgi:flagellar FliL protein
MKKNLISVAILVLLIVNIVLTSIMMFSVLNTNKKTAAFVTQVASAIHLELGTDGEAQEEETVTIDDIDTYTIADMTIQLKPSAITDSNGETTTKVHYVSTSIVLSMNKKNSDYKTYSADLENKVDLIKGEITDAFSQYTMEEASDNPQAVKDDILSRIRALYGSDFIFDVTLSNPLYQ